MDVQAETRGAEEVARRLRGIGEHADLRQVSGPVSEIVAEAARRWFASDGDGSWAELAESTLERKAREGLSPDPLVASGDLLASLDDPLVRESAEQLDFGTSVYYARFHSTGTGSMPARRVLGLEDRDRKQIVELLGSHLTEER